MRKAMTRKEWEEHLLKTEIQALEDYYYEENEIVSPNEAFEAIVQWEGGMSSAYQIKSLISRVYGIELQ